MSPAKNPSLKADFQELFCMLNRRGMTATQDKKERWPGGKAAVNKTPERRARSVFSKTDEGLFLSRRMGGDYAE